MLMSETKTMIHEDSTKPKCQTYGDRQVTCVTASTGTARARLRRLFQTFWACVEIYLKSCRERAALFHSVVYFAPEFKFDVNKTMKCEAERDRT